MRYDNDQTVKWGAKMLSGFYEIRAGNKDKTRQDKTRQDKTRQDKEKD